MHAIEMSSPVNGFAAASSSKTESASKSKLHLLHLPREALDTIFEHTQPRDLLTLLLVSRTFHEIAAAQLYRRLNHVFTDEDNKAGQLNVDHLAGILETLTTSDYNYAGHIKEISLDTLSTGENAEKASREFKYEYSCGKFLNTLLLGTLKKVRALETLRWNVRVEISPSVFTTLSKMESLQHLHVRLQAGRSLHSSTPTISSPPLMPPASGLVPIPPHPNHHHHHHHPHTHHHHHPPPPPPNQTGLGSYIPNVPKCTQCNGDGRPSKRLGVHKPTRTPHNFSKFSGLKSLAILDMDSLEYISEIAECISLSSSSLNHLSLSFSEALALKARKKTLPDASETETVQDEEDFDDGVPLPPPPAIANTPPLFGNPPATASHEADIRRERASQEKALSRIFSLEKENPQQRKLKHAAEQATVEADKEAQVTMSGTSKDDVDRLFVAELQCILRDLSRKRLASGAASKGIKSIETIEKAAAKYLERSSNAEIIKEKKEALHNYHKAEAHKHSSDASQSAHFKVGQDSLNSSPDVLDFDSTLNFLSHHAVLMPPPQAGPSSGNTSFNPNSKQTPVFSPFKPPFGQQGKTVTQSSPLASGPVKTTQPSWKLKPSDMAKASASTSETTSDVTPPAGPESAVASINGNGHKFDDEFADVVDMEHPDDDGEEVEDQVFLDDINDSPAEVETVNPVPDGVSANSGLSNGISEADLPSSTDKGKGKEPVREAGSTSETKDQLVEYSGERAIQEYIRQNHGISLESLSIYLIPVRASVLSRAVDISSLKHISLLNVGPQRAFWAMATKLHKTTPFQLTSVHTDNVTPSVLVFLNGLDQLTELFLSERSSRSKVEPLAPKTLVSIDDIKTQVLRKHLKHLKRLVIRNDDISNWALNKDCARLVTKYGRNLKELGITLGSTNFHLFMQHIGRLHSLAALQINFVHTDNCASVLREIRSCAVDNIMHFPHLKVEYVAVGHTIHGNMASSLAKLTRKSSRGRRAPNSKLNANVESTKIRDTKEKGKGKEATATNAELPWAPSDSDDDFGPFNVVSVRVIENFKPADVTGIKMWEKEIWGMRL